MKTALKMAQLVVSLSFICLSPLSALGLESLRMDTVIFDFRTHGINAQSFQSRLYVDTMGFATMNAMPFCDQYYIGSVLDPHLAIQKQSDSFEQACYPQSSFYPLIAVGEGWLEASGDPGYFFIPPDVLPGHQPVLLQGTGPHKVYWLGADHPDVEHVFEWNNRSVRAERKNGSWRRHIRIRE